MTGPKIQPYIVPGYTGNIATQHKITDSTVQTGTHQLAPRNASFQPPKLNFSSTPVPKM